MSVYFIGAENGLIKIGRSKNPKKRLRLIKTMSPISLELLGVIDCGRKESVSLERRLHLKFKDLRVHGEWFKPGTELLCFIWSDERLEINGLHGIDKPNKFKLSKSLKLYWEIELNK